MITADSYGNTCIPFRFGSSLTSHGHYPFTSRAIYAFEEIDGQDVLFFAMFTQEYDSDCPAPNTNKVFISYLDTVQLFQPKDLRTLVYQEIIIGYMQHLKEVG